MLTYLSMRSRLMRSQLACDITPAMAMARWASPTVFTRLAPIFLSDLVSRMNVLERTCV